MIVAVIAMVVMQMAADQIIDMIAVRNRLVTAIRAVPMLAVVFVAAVIRRAAIRIAITYADPMLFHPIAADVMQMPVVQIIGVAVVPHCRVSAIRAMHMRMPFMRYRLLSHAR